MIASLLHNFIYIKTHKTASSTVEMVVARDCGPDDIITPLGPAAGGTEDELSRGDGQVICRNYCPERPRMEKEMQEAILAGDEDAQKTVRRYLVKHAYWHHMPATELRARLPPEFWEKSFKFTSERHPYEKAVSQAFYRYKADADVSFDQHLSRVVRKGEYTDWSLYTIDGKMIADDFVRQETLAADLKRIGQRIGIVIPDPLPRSKGMVRHDKRPAREILSAAQKRRIQNVCSNEFEFFGYET